MGRVRRTMVLIVHKACLEKWLLLLHEQSCCAMGLVVLLLALSLMLLLDVNWRLELQLISKIRGRWTRICDPWGNVSLIGRRPARVETRRQRLPCEWWLSMHVL